MDLTEIIVNVLNVGPGSCQIKRLRFVVKCFYFYDFGWCGLRNAIISCIPMRGECNK